MLQELAQLRTYLTTLAVIPEDQWVAAKPLISSQVLEKGEFFLRIGEVSRNFGFVVSGLIRRYFVDAEGKEHNNHFAAENKLIGSYESLMSGRPSQFTVEALEPCRLLVMNFDDLKQLSSKFPAWREASLRAAENILVYREGRESQLLGQSVAERYQAFASEFPELVRRIPQYHIASFLGVTPEGLSRLLKRHMRDGK